MRNTGGRTSPQNSAIHFEPPTVCGAKRVRCGGRSSGRRWVRQGVGARGAGAQTEPEEVRLEP